MRRIARAQDRGPRPVYSSVMETLAGSWRELTGVPSRRRNTRRGSSDGPVRLCRIEPAGCAETELLGDLAVGPSLVRFSRDGRWLVMAALGTLHTWSSMHGKLEEKATGVPVSSLPTAMDTSPDGSLLVIGDGSGNLQYWELDTLRLLLQIPAHDGAVAQVAFSSDGTR